MAWHSFWARGSSSHHALPYHIPRSTGNILQSTGNILRNNHLVDSRACYLSRIRYNNQLALRCISNQTCSSITREAFFTFLGERVAVVKKHRASICDLKSAESAAFFFTGFIQNVFTCAGIGWTSKQLPFSWQCIHSPANGLGSPGSSADSQAPPSNLHQTKNSSR